MICEVYKLVPSQVGDLTIKEFNYMKDYAYRARVENLLGEHVFGKGSNTYILPGIASGKPQSDGGELGRKLKSFKKRTGKSVLTSSDVAKLRLI